MEKTYQQQSGKHTVREDTTNITKHLTEHQVTTDIRPHHFSFLDVTEDGWKNLPSLGWTSPYVTPTAETGVASDLQDELGEIEANYELYDVVCTFFHCLIYMATC